MHRKLAMKSNADMFAKRGDPWQEVPKPQHPVIPMSNVERELSAFRKANGMSPLYYAAEIRELTRTPVDPDMDRWTKAGFRKEKAEIKRKLEEKKETARDRVLRLRKSIVLKQALRNKK